MGSPRKQRALSQSGLFYESGLAQRGAQGMPIDLKALLLRLRARVERAQGERQLLGAGASAQTLLGFLLWIGVAIAVSFSAQQRSPLGALLATAILLFVTADSWLKLISIDAERRFIEPYISLALEHELIDGDPALQAYVAGLADEMTNLMGG